jgi:hypothetical protein
VRYELWELPNPPEDEGFGDYFPSETEVQLRSFAVEDGCVLTWSAEARGWNDARHALHEYCGWDPYKPTLREDGSPYPEDEDDQFQPAEQG